MYHPRLMVVVFSDDPSTLFRSNSKASKLLSASLRTCAVDYLRQVVGDVILHICTTLPSVEIDPNRLLLLHLM